jgi:hypothetical protein
VVWLRLLVGATEAPVRGDPFSACLFSSEMALVQDVAVGGHKNVYEKLKTA